MPTKFSEFFELRAGADAVQGHLFKAIENTENMVDCYLAVFKYIIEGLKWRSMKARHDKIDDAVDLTDLATHTSQIEDIEKFPDEDEWLLQPDEQVLFEKLQIEQFKVNNRPQTNQYTFNVNDNPAYKQVKFYLQLETYNSYAQDYKARAMSVVGGTPPPDPIKIDPKTAVPDSTQLLQVKELQDRTGKLIDWIKQNTPKLKAILDTPTGNNNKGLFDLVFGTASILDFSERLQAIGMMLEELKSNKNTLKPFGSHLVDTLKTQNTFWDNNIGGSQFKEITRLENEFKQSPGKNKKIYDHFQNLFANFLSEELYPGEDATAASTRQQTALAKSKAIFESFSDAKHKSLYDGKMDDALKTIQGKYIQEYTGELEEAKKALPYPPTILSMVHVMAIKRQADNFLGTLLLKLKNGGKENVSLLLITNYGDLKPGEVSHPRLEMPIDVDPAENTIPFYRPVFDSHRIADNSTDQIIKFCNLQDQKAGTFFYLVDDGPTIVKIKGKIGADKTSVGELTIDFSANTLTYSGKAKKPTENDAGELYVQEGKKGKFFDDVKARTKWTTLPGNRRYDPYYQTNPDKPDDPIPHLMGHLGSGRGLSRALPVEDDLYLWQWNYAGADKDDYKKLAKIFGLSPKRQIILDPTKPALITINAQQYDYSENTLLSSANSFSYKIISIKPSGKGANESEFYVQVNTPKPNIASELKLFPVNRSITPRQFEPSPGEVLTIFDFSYYRRVTPVVAADGTRSFDLGKSKIIQRFSPDDPRKPTGAIPLPDWSIPEKNALGLNLPVCFNLPENIQWYHTDKQQREKLINKGNILYREKKMRLNAATAMQPLYNNLKSGVQNNLSKSGLPATAFAKQAIQNSNKVKDDWQNLKKDAKNYFPVNQEWCHLMGHGDGGNEYLGNFVSGSYHCNTEQLAIETGQRNITQQAKIGDYVLHTTAYLLHDQDQHNVSEIIAAPYLTKEPEYTNLVSATLARHQAKLASIATSSAPTTTTTATTTSTVTTTSTTTTSTTAISGTSPSKKRPADGDSGQPSKKPVIEYGKSAPVAAYIRYKVMKNETTGRKKYFDYIFEGQSEFIDEHQFEIISRAVQFALAGKTELKNWIDSEK